MSRLSRIRIENYRAFERGLDLELRPLTLVYGKNNAGKSSVVRLLGIIHDSLAESAKSPFALGGAAGRGAAFLDVLNVGAREVKYLRLVLSWTDGLEASWRIGLYAQEGIERIRVEELIVRGVAAPEQAPMTCWYGDPKVPDAIAPEGATRVVSVVFSGLVPIDAPSLPPLFGILRARLLDMRGRVQYLSAIRAGLDKQIEERGTPPDLSADGKEAQEILLYDRAALTEVENWFRVEVKRDLRRTPLGPQMWGWLLPPTAAPHLSIPFTSTGEGMTQVLPILVALAQRQTQARPDGKRYLAMEEPTTHLHDDLQIQLARHFARVTMEADPPVILLETHARPLLLGVQLAILKERLDPSRVVLYWVDQDEKGASFLERVEFDEAGLPQNSRLRTAFADERRVLRELSQAHLRDPVPATGEHADGETHRR